MGIFQSVGGAATSGKGLTGSQIARALQETARGYRNADAPCGAGSPLDASTLQSDAAERLRALAEVDDSCYSAVSDREIRYTGENGKAATLQVREYAPDAFRLLRRLCGVSEESFADEWVLSQDQLKLVLGEGRSMAFFMKSKNMSFMCKTIAEVETQVLMRILKDYTAHLANHVDSLLMQFVMLIHVKVGREIGYIVCFKDSFTPCAFLNERWDIKGRLPKPGKYVHFPKLIKRQYDSVDSPEAPSTASSSTPPGPSKVHTMKDKELSRLFWVDPVVRSRLLEELESDFGFLMSVGLLDYSLLIGVQYNELKSKASERPVHRIENMRMAYALGAEGESGAVESRPQPSGAAAPKEEASGGATGGRQGPWLKDGIPSVENQETYYISVIDMLTTFTWKKATANFCKSILWEKETLSTLPPKPYHDRLCRYAAMIFPNVKDSL